mgnify:CR=1 FL=1
MIVNELIDKMDLKLVSGSSGLSKEVKGAYVCDLLSWVMAHADGGDAWITIQTHPNVVAVAVLLEISCIIIPENASIADETIKKADQEGIPLLVSAHSGYDLCCRMHDILKGA